MALVFYKSPEEPAQCAVGISRGLEDNARLQVRMGIHSGPVSGVVDVNERTNVAGAGVNMARRVMDCGDSGHLLWYCVFRGISVTSGRPGFERDYRVCTYRSRFLGRLAHVY